MNAKARALGLRGTHFANPHGLDQPGNYSTARDVVRLLRAALREPFIRTWAGRTRAHRRRQGLRDDRRPAGPAPVARRRQDRATPATPAGRRLRRLVRAASRHRGRARRELDAKRAKRRSRGAAPLGPAAVPPGASSSTRGARYARRRPGLGPRPGPPRGGAGDRPAGGACGARSSSAWSCRRCSRCQCAGASDSARCAIYDGDRLVARAPLVADRDVAAAGLRRRRRRSSRRRTVHHLDRPRILRELA